ncbi:hypothetical protein [uncultured Tateyamaria sp.]|uniref:hypothetical protein n=1 Tax=uncultured Tateyamaria sp. TaxID=455651 RepID=UPI00260A07F8|nr:hypothetical protein [uncultured Tateyamaria sp.]
MTFTTQPDAPSFARAPFFHALAANFIWINISEVFRYFVFVMPMMRDAFPEVPDIAPMNLPVFLIWGLWDTILVLAATFIPWLALRQFGGTTRTALIAGTGVWVTIFGILWLGLFNMYLATIGILLAALPLAWLEMVVAALIVWWFCFRSDVDRG